MKCNITLDLSGKCPNCGKQCINLTGNAKITISADDTEVSVQYDHS